MSRSERSREGRGGGDGSSSHTDNQQLRSGGAAAEAPLLPAGLEQCLTRFYLRVMTLLVRFRPLKTIGFTIIIHFSNINVQKLKIYMWHKHKQCFRTSVLHSCISTPTLQSASLRTKLKGAGCTN